MDKKINHLNKHKYLKDKLDKNTSFQNYLFCKGFVITNSKNQFVKMNSYPFYDNWFVFEKNGFFFYIHKKLKCTFYETIDKVFFMLGYALNAFKNELSEKNILKVLSEKKDQDFWEYESELTGIYVIGYIDKNKQSIYHWTDCAGMRIAYYGIINGDYYITSHTEILGYMFLLEEDSFVSQLKGIKYFGLLGAYLPADISAYKELKRSVPNHIYCNNGTVKRFYPIKLLNSCKNGSDYLDVLRKTSSILVATMNCCANKWKDNKKAISLTGGKDSGVTFACSKDCYDKFDYFSYISKDEEKIDAYGAKEICNHQLLPHAIIEIPNNLDNLSLDLLGFIIYCNNGFIGKIRENEVRKRLYFINSPVCDLEIKSWVDEISRAYYNKRFATKFFPNKPDEKYLSAFYKVFWFEKKAFKKTCTLFKEYINKYMNDEDLTIVGEWPILYSWEFGFSSLEGLNLISEHMLSQDIFIPFNCRKLIYTMIKPSLLDRINDKLQLDLIKINNETQYKLNINITNKAHTKFRARIEKVYLFIMTHFVI